MANNNLWLLTYTHEYGVDTSLYSSEEEANIASANIVLEYIDDIDDLDVRKKIFNCLKNKNYMEARIEYCQSRNSWSAYYEDIVVESIAPRPVEEFEQEKKRFGYSMEYLEKSIAEEEKE